MGTGRRRTRACPQRLNPCLMAAAGGACTALRLAVPFPPRSGSPPDRQASSPCRILQQGVQRLLFEDMADALPTPAAHFAAGGDREYAAPCVSRSCRAGVAGAMAEGCALFRPQGPRHVLPALRPTGKRAHGCSASHRLLLPHRDGEDQSLIRDRVQVY